MYPPLSPKTKQRVELVFKAYWLSPFCSGTVEIGETLVAWALQAEMLIGKAYADAYDASTKTAYQIKTGLPTSPVTFARLTTPSQFDLVNSNHSTDINVLGYELLEWVRNRIEEPKQIYDATFVKLSRIIYTKRGEFTYYERIEDPTLHNPQLYTWQWSEKGNALEGYHNNEKWFSWYPQGRRGTKNQNQLHYHGENKLIPPIGSFARHDFVLGRYSQIGFDEFMNAILKLIDENQE
jgi:hypothetical protein